MFDRLNFVRVRLLVALMMLCGAATILAPVSQATPQAPAQAPTMIVLDASGSMANADADALGTTRMEAAKSAARDVFASVGAASPLGLVVYGSSVPEVADEREAGCGTQGHRCPKNRPGGGSQPRHRRRDRLRLHAHWQLFEGRC
ncbi:vWA domain-containing protein [Corynebacterium flavescens]|uniref:vWA domain-containing protein n=1 Tax=Corynebacterium flavescens TaxID=28028 RepID=UPI002647D7CE|nr:VWA domain-containing protein [Corynebacterium flavescens]MDN6521833.1 VWA domain-containing protein [Bifidobacterium crudilactis]MDN6552860.1 VWA domain-containing protein [Corynebacterium flavescens]